MFALTVVRIELIYAHRRKNKMQGGEKMEFFYDYVKLALTVFSGSLLVLGAYVSTRFLCGRK